MTSSTRDTRPKIVFVNRYFAPDQSATSQLLSDLSFGLAARGLDIHVICSRQLYDQPRGSLERRQSIQGVTVHRVWTTRFGRGRLTGRALDYLSFYLSCAWTLLRLLRRADTVVAKTDPPLLSIVAAAAAGVRGARLINWLQDIFPEVASRLGLNPLPQWLDSALCRARNATLLAADKNIVLGRRMYENLRNLGVPPEKIEVIENWAGEAGAANDPAADGSGAGLAGHAAQGAGSLRERLGLTHKFVVGYSGNLGRAHEYQTVLEAAQRLDTDPQIVFLMIGAGSGMHALKRTVLQRGLRNFQFLPHQPRAHLADSLAAADVHWVSLLPALEGLIVPSKAYGILAAARPLIFIGDREGEVATLVTHGAAGFSVDVGAAGALAELIQELKADAARRASLGRNGYRLYRERFTVERALVRWSAILNPAAQPSSRSRISLHNAG